MKLKKSDLSYAEKMLVDLQDEHIRKLKRAKKLIEEIYMDRGWERPNLSLSSILQDDIDEVMDDQRKCLERFGERRSDK